MSDPVKRRQNYSQFIVLIGIGVVLGVSLVTTAAETSPWVAGVLSQTFGGSPSSWAGEGGCCGGACPIE